MRSDDRLRLAVAFAFDECSEYTAHDSPYSDEETVAELRQKSVFTQYTACRDISRLLTELCANRALLGILPASVRAVAERQTAPNAEALKPLFAWLPKLFYQADEILRAERNSVFAVVQPLGQAVSAFFESFTKLVFQTVFFQNENGSVSMTVQGDWGKTVCTLTGVSFTDFEEGTSFGQLFQIGGMSSDRGQYRLRFLFQRNLFPTVAQWLDDASWSEYTVTFSGATVQTDLYDYGNYFRFHGLSGENYFLACAFALIQKCAYLGENALTPKERELMDPCTAMLALFDSDTEPQYLPPIGIYPISPTDQLFEQRFVCHGAIQFLADNCGDFGRQLAETLDTALVLYEDGELAGCDKTVQAIRRFLRGCTGNGMITAFYAKTEPMFLEATAAYPALCDCSDKYKVCLQTLRETLSPIAEQHHFFGKFPHFVRIDTANREAQYISVCTEVSALDGYTYFPVHLSVTKTHLKSLSPGDQPTVGFYQPEDASANCISPTVSGVSHADINTLADGNPVSLIPNGTAISDFGDPIRGVTEMMHTALAALEGEPLPGHYKTYRHSPYRRRKLFLSCLRDGAAFGVFCVILMLALQWMRVLPIVSDAFLQIGLYIGAFAVCTALFTGIAFLLRLRRFWETP